MSHRILLLIIWVACLACLAPSTTRAADAKPETWVVAGRTYERVRVLEVTAATVMIAHGGGMVQLDLANLPANLQQRFNYDPAAAAAWLDTARSGLADTAALERRELEAKKRRSEREAAELAAREKARVTSLDFADVEIRASVDLRPVFTRHKLYLKSQGAQPACAIYALVCALEYDYARRFDLEESFSESFLIWAVQQTRPDTPVNDGYHFEEILDAMTEHGVARRSLVPVQFNPYAPDARPSDEAITDARGRRGFDFIYYRSEDARLLERIIDSLNRETPVIIGVRWPNWESIEKQALLRDQVPLENGAHAVTLIGYRSNGTRDGVDFLFRNSYGPQWGFGGCAWISQSYLRQHLLLAFSITVPSRS